MATKKEMQAAAFKNFLVLVSLLFFLWALVWSWDLLLCGKLCSTNHPGCGLIVVVGTITMIMIFLHAAYFVRLGIYLLRRRFRG